MEGRCGARTKSGGVCKNRPLSGRKRCKFHGGATPRGPDSANWEHGRKAYQFHGELLEKFRAAASVEDPTDLLPELATQRTLFSHYLERFVDGYKIKSTDIDSMMRWLDAIGKTVERIVKIRNETMLTVAETQFLQASIIGLLDDFIPDPNKRKAFVSKLIALIPERTEPATIISAE